MNIISQSVQKGSGKLKVMVKDTIDIQGLKTIAGSRALLEVEPAHDDAEVVKNILKADCEIIGKTNLHELAFGITGINHAFGTPINPKYPELIPGGSSSGSAAAVAAKQADFTLGTDTGGSIRMPAACCGVFGLKPTFGRVSRQGVYPPSSSLDCVGPFANSVEMIEKAMQIIDPTFKPAECTHTPKLAVLDVSADEIIWNCIYQALQKANLETVLEKVEHFEAAYDAGMQIINYENWQAFGELTQTGLIGSDVNNRLLKASHTNLEQVKQAEVVKAQLTKELDALLEKYDALVLPTLPQIPPKVSEAENTVAFLNLTGLVRPFNLSGHPAISVPLETSEGLPVGLQIVSKHQKDEQLCAIAKFCVDAMQ
ncbi:amidase [Acinetobacter baumannii]